MLETSHKALIYTAIDAYNNAWGDVVEYRKDDLIYDTDYFTYIDNYQRVKDSLEFILSGELIHVASVSEARQMANLKDAVGQNHLIGSDAMLEYR